jgi:hypothetical protein
MPKLIFDEFTSMPISPQWRYQLRKRATGKCRICGVPSNGKQFCEIHNRDLAASRKARLPFTPKAAAADLPVPSQEEII